MRLGKSTSWGLASISPQTIIYRVNFYRPLLYTSINYINKYIQDNNIKIFEDYTNNTNKYTRNLIRHSMGSIPNRNKIQKDLVFYVDERKKYEELINLWIKIHLVILNRFSYKFLWNRLPLCEKLSSFILVYIGEKIRGRRIDSHERFLPFIKNKINFHVNDCKFTQRGDYTYVEEILPTNIKSIILKYEGVWWYKFLIIDLLNRNREFNFHLKKLPVFVFNREEINLEKDDFLSKNNFLIKYIGYNFQSKFN
jgi:hypothetical protein